MKTLLIKNSWVVNADKSFHADIRIREGIIEKIENEIIGRPGDQVIDAEGKWVIPGGIDPHVHLNLPTLASPSSDDFYTGSRAALAGGTTTLIDFVTPHRRESLLKALKSRKNEAKNCLTNLYFHMGITCMNESIADEMRHCVRDEGIFSFKTYLAYKESIGISYEELYKVMQIAAELDAIVAVHCEDGEQVSINQQRLKSEGRLSPGYHAISRPAELETRAVESVIKMVEATKCRVYIVHVSAGDSVNMIMKAQKKGLPVFAETCPHYLLFSDEVYKRPDEEVLRFIMSPPIRGEADRCRLWEGISDKIIDVISTDHCPFNLRGQKDIGIRDFTRIPNGTGSIENRLSLIFTYGVLQKRITPEHWVGLVSAAPARIFGMSARKGSIDEGKDADLIIWNPDYTREISAQAQLQRCDHTIYEGLTLQGWPDVVIRNGLII